MLGLVSVRIGDRLRAGNYVTSHPGQLSLAIPLWVGAMSTSLGWEGNCRSGVALIITDNVKMISFQHLFEHEIALILLHTGSDDDTCVLWLITAM